MKQFVGVATLLLFLLIQLCCTAVQTAPHMSAEDSDESTSSAEPESESDSVVNEPPVDLASHELIVHVEDTTQRHMVISTGTRPEETDRVVLDTRSSEETDGARDSDESDEDDATVQFPKAGAGHCPMCPKGPPATAQTGPLCPARPEEITKIEADCAEEYRLWKEMRARKSAQAMEVNTPRVTTPADIPREAMSVDVPQEVMAVNIPVVVPPVVEATTLSMEGFVTSSSEDMQMTTLDMTTLEVTMIDSATADETVTEEDSTDMPTTVASTTSTFPTTTRPIRRKHKRSRKIVKKSCYPATCILRKLNLLDSMGQPSISRIQSFAVNMTVDNSKSLEEKAVGCVREINEAMIDASGDIGKKVGCVAQKVITCLNKGLTCPIMKVSQ